MKYFDSLPLWGFVAAAIMFAIAPIFPQPHLLQKFHMLLDGQLTKPIDIFDLFWHSLFTILLVVKILRIRWLNSRPKWVTVNSIIIIIVSVRIVRSYFVLTAARSLSLPRYRFLLFRRFLLRCLAFWAESNDSIQRAKIHCRSGNQDDTHPTPWGFRSDKYQADQG